MIRDALERNRRRSGRQFIPEKGIIAKSKGLMKEVDRQAFLFRLCSQSGSTDQMMELAKKRNDVLLYDWKAIADQ